HADLDGVGADIVQRRLDLAAHDFRRHRIDRRDLDRVLHRDGGDRGLGVDPEGLGCLEIGLDSSAAGRVGTGDDQKPGNHYAATSSIADAIWRTTARTTFSSSPSAITRISGSVPDLRTRMRPEAPSLALAASMLDLTFASSSGEPFLKR